MVKVGDQVLLVAGGVSVFRVVEIEGDDAVVESAQDAPGRYRWSARVSELVAADADTGGE
ncbi:hypothetical protein ACLMAL_26550 [Nocardia sp. CWNU-33]|uniref:hypothetical protein n=1 Tax=Nocardia sp. CWNU-33 TaxID=3392117 RepID=UPI00398E9D0B